MKNITVSVDDETYRRARIAAAANDTSVSAMVRAVLEDLTASRVDLHSALNLAASERLKKRFGAPIPLEMESETPDQRFERLRLRQLEILSRIKNFSASDNVPREELYRRGRED